MSVSRGSFPPFPPICHPEEQSDEESPFYIEEDFALLETLPVNDFMPLGKSWKGGKTLVPIECHPEPTLRWSLYPPSPRNAFLMSLLPSVTPRSASDEGSPPFNRVGELTLLDQWRGNTPSFILNLLYKFRGQMNLNPSLPFL